MGLETERAKGLRESGGSGCRAGEAADKGEWCGVEQVVGGVADGQEGHQGEDRYVHPSCRSCLPRPYHPTLQQVARAGVAATRRRLVLLRRKCQARHWPHACVRATERGENLLRSDRCAGCRAAAAARRVGRRFGMQGRRDGPPSMLLQGAGIECRVLCGAGGGRDRWCVRASSSCFGQGQERKGRSPLSCPLTPRRQRFCLVVCNRGRAGEGGEEGARVWGSRRASRDTHGREL